MLELKKVGYVKVDRELYDRYKSKELSPSERRDLHIKLFYPATTVVRFGKLENLEDVVSPDGIIKEGEATVLYRELSVAPHPILFGFAHG